MQDITPPNQDKKKKRSIRDIERPSQGSKKTEHTASESGGERHIKIRYDNKQTSAEEQEAETSNPSEVPSDSQSDQEETENHKNWPSRKTHDDGIGLGRPRRNKHGNKLKWISASVGLLVILVLSAYLFSNAEIIVQPKQLDIDVDAEYLAVKSDVATDQNYDLTFSTVSRQEQISTTLDADGMEEVSSRARGVITVYNEFSDASQTLVATTRFEDSEGRIFRTEEAITVPGMTADGEPGTVEVEVVADEPGEEYNIEPATFTIPGFAGSPQFEAFSAESDSPFVGGGSGVRPVVDDEELEATLSELESQLESELLAVLDQDLPAGIQLIENDTIIEFSHELTAEAGDDQATLTLTGTAIGLLVSEEDLSQVLARDFADNYSLDEQVRLADLDRLTIYIEEEDLSSDTESVDLLVAGQARLVWVVDEEALINSLARERRSHDNVQQILSRYSSQLENVEVINVRPPWRMLLPGAENIKLIIEE